MSRCFFPRLAALVAFSLAALRLGAAESDAKASPLQLLVDRAVANAVTEFAGAKLTAEQLAVTLIDLRTPAGSTKPVSLAAAPHASHRGEVQIYPASVIKLFYLAAAHAWLEDGRLTDGAELRRAMKDMIVDSSNDATHYVIDVLTGTTSGPELPDDELKNWFDRRNAVTRHFAALGYTGVLAHKKPWGDGPYGRESQASRTFEPRRNMLTTDATARLLAEIATGQSVTAARSGEMMQLLARNPATSSNDPDDQATKFTAPALPPGTKLWSKAGWTSQTRHDAAYIELPNGGKYVLVTFTTGQSRQPTLISAVARTIVTELAK